MATFTPDKVTPDKVSSSPKTIEIPAATEGKKLHTGPIARLLDEVSKTVGIYAEYRVKDCLWRKLAI